MRISDWSSDVCSSDLFARAEMAKLTSDLDLQCVATAVVGDELMSLAKTGDTPADQGIRRVGERRPFVPPLGLGHVAWAKPELIESYFGRLATSGSSSRDRMLRAYLRQSLEAIRRRGYAMAADGPAMKSVWQAIWENAANTQTEKYRLNSSH